MQPILDWASANSSIVISVIIFMVEAALRIFKTEEPKSLLIYAANLLHKIADISSALSKILDGVVQRLQ